MKPGPMNAPALLQISHATLDRILAFPAVSSSVVVRTESRPVAALLFEKP